MSPQVVQTHLYFRLNEDPKAVFMDPQPGHSRTWRGLTGALISSRSKSASIPSRWSSMYCSATQTLKSVQFWRNSSLETGGLNLLPGGLGQGLVHMRDGILEHDGSGDGGDWLRTPSECTSWAGGVYPLFPVNALHLVEVLVVHFAGKA